ncbi:hypothetical protein L195_g004251 [Trifolium pratense]|uniref:DUF4283 domain-containing protein n=1 Tax=Trifolium pratense TaxID=57577 RepID=A0A2K3NXI7_TRIPR|nr:hypothetical protein L195_g004251 [Trifolium pratense]
MGISSRLLSQQNETKEGEGSVSLDSIGSRILGVSNMNWIILSSEEIKSQLICRAFSVVTMQQNGNDRAIDRNKEGGEFQKYDNNKDNKCTGVPLNQNAKNALLHCEEGDRNYAQVVRNGSKLNQDRSQLRIIASYEAAKEDMERLKKSYVGVVLNPGMSYNVQNAFHRQAKGWLDQWFKEICPWSPKDIDVERTIWLRIYDIPTHAWNDLFFALIVKLWGSFINADDGTTKKITMDVARLMIRTSCQQVVDEFIDVLVNGEVYHLRVLEDSYGPMGILISQDHGHEERGSDDESEEEERRLTMVEEELERESVGEKENSLALNHFVNANNDHDDVSISIMNRLQDREEVLEDLNFLDPILNVPNFGVREASDGGVVKLDSKLMKVVLLLGQDEESGGPQNSANIQHTITEGAVRRFTRSEDMGRVTNDSDDGCKREQRGWVYSDGPRCVYQKLNKGPITKETLLLNSQTSSQTPKRPNLIPANVRKQNQLIQKLNLRVSHSDSLNSEARSFSSGMYVSNCSATNKADGVVRSSSSRHRAGKKAANSISSVGIVLCCSSLNSSDFRNCNKIFVNKYAHDSTCKVWQRAVELGVEGEEEERYIERIIGNENKEDEARILREQQQQSFP